MARVSGAAVTKIFTFASGQITVPMSRPSVRRLPAVQALKKIGYADGVSPEPLGRVPAEMSPEDGAKLALDTTLAVMKKAGVA